MVCAGPHVSASFGNKSSWADIDWKIKNRKDKRVKRVFILR
jgi:hypothetical protein